MSQSERQDFKTHGRWTKQEHQKFLLGLQLYGKDWKKIQDFLQTRNGAQIRSHAQKFFLRVKKEVSSEAPAVDYLKSFQQPNNFSTELPQDSPKLIRGDSQEYSYFMEKIVKLSSAKSQFDFWEALIDQKSCEQSQEIQTEISKRKDSFLSLDEPQVNQKAEKLGSLPSKKVKTTQ